MNNSNIVGFQLKEKLRCVILEEQLAELVVTAMESHETALSSTAATGESDQLMWHHLSGQLIYFVLFQFASFPHVVTAIIDKVNRKLITASCSFY